MPRSRCAFCDHANPPGSRFCNECGSPLHLQPCAQCDAVNDEAARNCYRCGVALPVTADETAEAAHDASPLRVHVPEAFGEALTDVAQMDVPTTDADRGAHAGAQPPSPPDVETVESIVVPPDESRLVAARKIALARRRNRARSALAVLLAITATATVYYEYGAPDRVGEWLRTLKKDVLGAIRAQPPSNTVDEATREREHSVAPLPPSTAGEAEQSPTTGSAPAAPPIENATSPAPPSAAEAVAAPAAVTPAASEQPSP